MRAKQHYLTKPDAARYCGVSVRTIDRLLAEGKLKRYRLRGHILIARSQLERAIRSSAVAV